MKKLKLEDICCTIEQGEKLDELLDRVGKYGDNLFYHMRYLPGKPDEIVQVLHIE